MNKKIYLLFLAIHCFAPASKENTAEKQETTEQKWSNAKKALIAGAIVCTGIGVSLLLKSYSSAHKHYGEGKNTSERLSHVLMCDNVDEVQALVRNPQVDLMLPIYSTLDKKDCVARNALLYAIHRTACSEDVPKSMTIFNIILGHFKTAGLLNQQVNGDTYLIEALYQGGSQVPLAVIEALLNAGADPNGVSQYYDGATPLHIAVYRFDALGKDDGCVTLLLAKGADRKKTDLSGRTPFEFVQKHFLSKSEEYKKLHAGVYKAFQALLKL